MTHIKNFVSFLVLVLALGVVFAGLSQTVAAQTEKDKDAREKLEKDDDDMDDSDIDEMLSPADKKKVKLTMDEARSIALKRVSGTIVEEELEKENGRLQYAFDIKDSSGKMFDIEIDAITGEVLQAVEDDDGENNVGGSVSKAKNPIVRSASAVKDAAVKVFAQLF